MEVRQCDFCRMPYQSTGKRICGDCLLKLDEDFIEIREYLWEHDGAGIDEVIEATGVSRKSIMYLLKEERLLVGDESEPGRSILTCESCRRPIRTGRMCEACKNEVLSAIQESVGVVINKPKPRLEPEPAEEKSIKGIAKLQLKGR